MNASPNRRRLLLGALTAGITASVAAAIPAFAALKTQDSVLGLVAAHKAAWTRLIELDDCCDHETIEQAARAADVALDSIMETPPTTLDGMRAALVWLMEFEQGRIPETSGAYLALPLRSPLLAEGGLNV